MGFYLGGFANHFFLKDHQWARRLKRPLTLCRFSFREKERADRSSSFSAPKGHPCYSSMAPRTRSLSSSTTVKFQQRYQKSHRPVILASLDVH